MEKTFAPGEVLSDERGMRYTVVSFLGSGGQGNVYRIRAQDGTESALKWYHEDSYLKRINARAFRENLRRNIENGAPRLMSTGDVADQFIWPRHLVTLGEGFGYTMDLYKPGFDNYQSVVLGFKNDPQTGRKVPVRFSSYFAMVTAALNIVRGFEILHAAGYSYQDINGGGFFINTKTGDVLICDCDNVSPDKENLGIRGVVTYMAPEVVRGDSLPNAHTDRYSMAVLLFRLFYRDHPMLGSESCEILQNPSVSDDVKNIRIYGTAPHYCLDSAGPNPPHPKRNRDLIRFYAVYPKALLDLFQKIFVDGAMNPAARPTDTQWRRVLLSVRDSLVPLQYGEQFYDLPVPMPLPSNCRTLVNAKLGRRIRCMPGKLLYACHTSDYGSDYKTPVARIVELPDHPKWLGLMNGMRAPIRFLTPNKRQMDCAPGKIMALAPGMKIRLGETVYDVE